MRSTRTVTVIMVVAALAWAMPVLDTTRAEAARPETSVRRDVVSVKSDSARAQQADGRRGWAVAAPVAAGDAVMIGAAWTADVEVELRTRANGQWSDWVDVHRDTEEHVPDPDSAERESVRDDVSEPVWTGHSDEVQFRASQPVDLDVTFVDSRGGSGLEWSPRDRRAGAADAGLGVLLRREWGADESLRDGRMEYSSSGTVRFSVIHHIGGSDPWTWDEIRGGCRKADDMIRGIYEYHTVSRGYWDIAYNFVVDPCGTVWEARAGGITRPVQGAHAGGFNDGSVGVLALGTFSGSNADPVTRAMVDSIEELLGSKLRIDSVQPGGRTRETSGGGSARWPEGEEVYLPVLSAHQISNTTSCPGAVLMNRLFDGVNQDALPTSEYVTGVRQEVANAGWDITRLADWNGDGAEEMLLYDRSTGEAVIQSVAKDGSFGGVINRYALAPGWDVISLGDWESDPGDEFIFYRQKDGAYAVYSGTPAGWIGTRLFVGTVNTGWEQIVTGDFKGDDRDEVIFYRRSDGRYASYEMGQDGRPRQRLFGGYVNDDWERIVAGDWDLDDRGEELLFYRRDTGWFTTYRVTASGRPYERTFAHHVNPGWDSIMVGDLNQVGRHEMAFYRRGDGRYAVYTPEGDGRPSKRTFGGSIL